jgi:urocanate reductase
MLNDLGPGDWGQSFDVVVVGAGAGGLPAAIAARDEGASVLLVEQNFDIGGRAILSGGAVFLGGGHAYQKKCGVDDSPARIFADWTRTDHPLGRYNDRELLWTMARASVATYDFLVANDVEWELLEEPTRLDRVRGRLRVAQWPNASERIVQAKEGAGLMRPLAASAKRKGVVFLLQHRMRSIIRECPFSGRVSGIVAEEVDRQYEPTGETARIEARHGVIVATGGHGGDVDFRRMFDPRLTEEYQPSGDGWTPRRADGEKAAMAIGASLWGAALQTNEADGQLSKGRIGVRVNYHDAVFTPESPNFFREKASGLTVDDYQNVILVKENGRRFYDETAGIRDYGYFAAAMEWTGDPRKLNGGGPIWAIFDSQAAAREGWTFEPPHVDTKGYFFAADTLEELASRIDNPHQWRPMPPGQLRATVERYNGFVRAGADSDFGKPAPRHAIETPPFYAAWSTPVVHDVYVGLRTNTNAEVVDMNGEVIDGLYAVGESQGGIAQHGIGRAMVFGRIAGLHAGRRASAERMGSAIVEVAGLGA